MSPLIERASVSALTGVTAMAAAAAQPVYWHFFGQPIEAASMTTALFAATTTRIIIGLRTPTGYARELATLAIVLATTAAAVATWPSNLVGSLLYGTGFGVIGEGILSIAKKWTDSAMQAAGVEPPSPPGTLAPDDDDHPAAISAAMATLKGKPPVERDPPPSPVA